MLKPSGQIAASSFAFRQPRWRGRELAGARQGGGQWGGCARDGSLGAGPVGAFDRGICTGKPESEGIAGGAALVASCNADAALWMTNQLPDVSTAPGVCLLATTL